MMVEDLVGQVICLFFRPRKKTVRFFTYCIFGTILRGKIAPELTIRVSSPQGLGKITSRAFGSYFFLVLSLSALFCLFVFFSFSFHLFSSFL
jgi:hypothetical protein